MASSVHIFSRVIYRTVYIFLHLLLLALLLATPGDIINQSRQRSDIVSILIVAACYVFSILVVAFVFFLRLFLKRGVLNSIPKSWIPIEKGDVSKPVRAMIAAGLSRSAAIAFVSRPRVVPEELLDEMCPMLAAGVFMTGGKGGLAAGREGGGGGDKEDGGGGDVAADAGDHGGPPGAASVGATKKGKAVRFKKVETVEMEKELGINLPPCLAVWGEIEHPGWAPPDQPWAVARARAGGGGGGGGGGAAGPLDENVNLQYSTVLAELPNLIEAKALTLAPPDPMSPADPPLLDAEAVALLERPLYMGLREYLTHLAGLGVIDMFGDGAGHGGADGDHRPLSDIVPSFATAYEYARFSTQMLTHEAFRQLMHDLATILRRMAPLDPSVLLDDDDEYDEYEKEGSYGYGEADDRSDRPYFAGGSEEAGEDDIDNNAARSSPTTPPRSRSQRSNKNQFTEQQQQQLLQQHQQQQRAYEPVPRRASQPARSSSASSRRSTYTSSTGSSIGSSQRSDGTSRRRHLQNGQAEDSPSASRNQRRLQRSTRQSLLPPPQDGQTRAAPRRARRAAAPAGSSRPPRRPSSRSSSANSFAQSRHPYAVSSQPSSASLGGSTASLRSSASGGSVIRLADRAEQSLGLPYVIMTPTTSAQEDERLF